MTLAPDDPRHGEPRGYTAGCRCVPCREAKREYNRAYNAANAERLAAQRRANAENRHAAAVRYRETHREELRVRALLNRGMNREEIRIRDAERRARNALSRREQQAQYRAANADKIRERMAAYYAANAARLAEYNAAYRASEEGRAARIAANARRRARRRAQDCGCCTADALRELWARDGGVCAYCGGPGAHFDHVVPLARGGWHCTENLRVACERCNCSKKSRPLDLFLKVLAGRGVEVMPNATAPGLPCVSADMRDIDDPWKVA